ncbi:hypothetical protein DFH07DRAFT_780027 [Mycena maculata]|uniref:Uncharacterized protein n=1 Tax=Mycena maculata TaxID=230809 RepID=A0AAD7I6D3_9AGAR|nr:hypothetical protein DFH07DRAFT_780027 [Mycena maculata]
MTQAVPTPIDNMQGGEYADVNVQGGFYGTALQAALLAGPEVVVWLLIEKRDTTALWHACAKGHDQFVQLLIASGANIHKHEHYGTALQVASAWGHQTNDHNRQKAILKANGNNIVLGFISGGGSAIFSLCPIRIVTTKEKTWWVTAPGLKHSVRFLFLTEVEAMGLPET